MLPCAQLLRIGPWKDGAGLAVHGVLLPKTSGCCRPAGYQGTYATIAVATTCAGRLPQRRRRLFRAFFQATKDHFARGSLMDGGHNRRNPTPPAMPRQDVRGSPDLPAGVKLWIPGKAIAAALRD